MNCLNTMGSGINMSNNILVDEIITSGTLPTIKSNASYYSLSFMSTGNATIKISTSTAITFYYLLIGGGGAGGAVAAGSNGAGAGGGAGGMIEGSFTITGEDAITVTVGEGGVVPDSTISVTANQKGKNSSITFVNNTSNNLTAYGGGAGQRKSSAINSFCNGGSGGGYPSNSGNDRTGANGGTGISGQGHNGCGFIGDNATAGGGGGSSQASTNQNGGNGKKALSVGILSVYPNYYWAGGGGGGTGKSYTYGGNGGDGGGGGGGGWSYPSYGGLGDTLGINSANNGKSQSHYSTGGAGGVLVVEVEAELETDHQSVVQVVLVFL